MNKFIFILMLLLCIAGIKNEAFSSNSPVIFGKISVEEFKLYDYITDTNESLSCIVLCDYGYFHSLEFRFVRTLRLKILKTEGCKWLEEQAFITPAQTEIRGRIINLYNDKLYIKKIRNSSIVKKNIQNRYFTTRFFAPFVKKGSIIDLEFSYRGIPFEWQFQLDIPVKWSEIIIPDSPYITFQKKISGYEPLFVHGKERWVAKNMPAFNSEPDMGPEVNLKTKIEFEVISINYPGLQKKWPTSWKSAVTYLRKNEYFGGALRGSFYLNNVVKKIHEECDTEEQKLKAAFAYVKQIRWNKVESLFSTTPFMNTVYKNKYGNSADINIILIQLLKKLGLHSFPLILSTRQNGYVSHTFPNIRKLNYVIAFTKTGNKHYYLDATQQFTPHYLIPLKCLNRSGRVLYKNKTEEIVLKPMGKRKEIISYDIKLNKNTTINGTIKYEKYEYSALNFRKKYNTFHTHTDYLKEFKSDKPGIEILCSKIKNLNDFDLPVIEEFEIKLDDPLKLINSKFHMSPLLFKQLTKNPLQLKERKYPIDFVCPIEKEYFIKITVPENLRPIRFPKSLIKSLPDNSAIFIFAASNDKKKIHLKYSYSIKKTVFNPDEYKLVKYFFDLISQKMSEPVVFQEKVPAHTMK